MGLNNILDIGTEPKHSYWTNFISHLLSQYTGLPDFKNFRHRIDTELTEYKATWMTDHSTYSKIYFENEKYKTIFLLRWS